MNTTNRPQTALISALVSLSALSGAAHAAVLVNYSFTGVTQSLENITAPPTSTALNVTATDINLTGSLASLLGSFTPANSLFLGNLLSTASDSVNGNRYCQFTLTPDPGYQLNLASFSFDVTRGGASTPRGWELRSSVDGFVATLGTGLIPTARPTFTSVLVDLSGPSSQGLTTETTFRFYGFMPAQGANLGIYLDNVQIDGSVQVAVPEPAETAAVVGLGVGAFAWLRRNRKPVAR
jgi:hypothetical protein